MNATPILEVNGLTKHYPVSKGILFSREVGRVRAVDGVDFSINEGETLGLVGESGCGKTTTSRLVLGLEPPTAGEVLLEGVSAQDLTGRDRQDYHAKVQAVFQDPWSSLNPRMHVGQIVGESLRIAKWGTRAEIDERVAALLVEVGLRPEHARQYPHEFSGGQRQRIALASALAIGPKLIVLDEPVSALDVTIRAQMMNLLKDVQEQDNVAYLLVAHDLATVRHMSEWTAVMYLGEIVEYAPTELLFENVRHPYTRALFSAVLPDHPDGREEEMVLTGEVPSPLDPPSGCRFHTRCPFAMDICSQVAPPLTESESGHLAACHLEE
ncbi:MAG: ATP-binding cassette domain-containing protein [Alphaproteobacteria bacterium]|nr:ATP-binding cassette domain-containing protein [Alphaproteobacteria bacterium]